MLSSTLCFVICCIFWKLILHLTTGKCTSNRCLIGKTAIVTGGNSGIGFEIALDLAKRGCKVIIADIVNAENTCNKIIEQTGNHNVFYKYLNLGALISIRKFAEDILYSEDHLDILINNAGVAGFEGIFTDDGLLTTMQINYFGHFLLTHLLVGILKVSQGRVVFVSSCAAFAHSLTSCANINQAANTVLTPLNISNEYSNSKLCNIIAANIFAKKLKKFGILCYSAHPGVIRSSILLMAYKNSNKSLAMYTYYTILQLYSTLFGKAAKDGAQTILHCALSRKVNKLSGQFFWDCIPFYQPAAARNSAFCSIVWKITEDFVKLKPCEKI